MLLRDIPTDVMVRLSRAPVVSIASIRGRARGAGSEFVLATDLRFASRENAVLGQFEVGMGVVPGGAPTARLARLVGRGRALEILLVSELTGPIADFRELFTRPAQQEQWARLQALGLNTDSDIERSLGRRVVESIA